MTATTHGQDGGRKGWRIARWSGAAALLALPLVAMQFGDEVNWTLSDFIVMGGLMALVLGAYEFLAARAPTLSYRAASVITVLGVFLLIWMNLAVGIIGSENNGANLMFAGIIAIIVGGTCIAQFRSAGMGLTMIVAALAQLAVGAIALLGDLGTDGKAWPLDVIVLSGFYAGLWLLAATLFRLGARES